MNEIEIKRIIPQNELKYFCEVCDKWMIPIEGVNAIYQRGYWWCAKHVKIAYWDKGEPIVDFPCGSKEGKMIPKTIIHEE